MFNVRDNVYMNIAFEISKLSKCVSKKVGCIVVKDQRILASGYNGTPSGFLNCSENFDKNNFNRNEHHEWSNIYEIHGELNLICFCAKNGIELKDSVLYTTLKPCYQCTKNIIQSGIIKIIYKDEYDLESKNNKETDNFLNENHVKIEKLITTKEENV